jgi:hypothetical protein
MVKRRVGWWLMYEASKVDGIVIFSECFSKTTFLSNQVACLGYPSRKPFTADGELDALA